MSITVTARGVVKAFDGKPVLRGVDLDVPEGRSTVLVGPSSSGKSVLLKCLLGLMPMDGGSVRYGDTALATLDKSELERLMRDVGVLFQQNALFDSLTVWENVAFTLIHGQGMARRAARQRALETIASVGLKPDVADLSPGRAFRGMQKRVALAARSPPSPDSWCSDARPPGSTDPDPHDRSLISGAPSKKRRDRSRSRPEDAVARESFDRSPCCMRGRSCGRARRRDRPASGGAHLIN